MRAWDAARNNIFDIAPAHHEIRAAFVENPPPCSAPAMFQMIGRREGATGRPKRGAPNVTETVMSRTAVAERVENVAYSER